MDSDFEEQIEDQEEGPLDMCGRWLAAVWTWVCHVARRIVLWMRRRLKIIWLDRDILRLREEKSDALRSLGHSVYQTFRDDVGGRPELMTQVDQIQDFDLKLSRKRRVRDQVEREELV